MGKILRSKGRKPLFMQIMVVVTWLGAMFFGSIVYSIFVVVTQGQQAVGNIGWSVYPWALLSAVLGQAGIFLIAWLVPRKIDPTEAVVEAFT